MSTRSYVGYLDSTTKKIHYIYVHFDGYPSGVGEDIQPYDTEEKVKAMLMMGDRSTIKGPYYKDRGEMNTGPHSALCEISYILEGDGIDYLYLFKEDKWFFCNMHKDQKNFIQLSI
jgi:hypothetical protein